MSAPIKLDPESEARFQQWLSKQPRPEIAPVPTLRIGESGLASTFLISRSEGGVGATLLALMIKFLLQDPDALIIQAGGMRSWGYKELTDDEFMHFQPNQEHDLLADPLDHRLAHAGRHAIIEYDASLPRTAIEAAVFLAGHFKGHAPFFAIAGRDDSAFRLADRAREQKIANLVVLQQASLRPIVTAGAIKIPSVPRAIIDATRQCPREFAEHIWRGPPAASLMFRGDLNRFVAQITEVMS